MKFFLVVGIVASGTFLITNVHSSTNGLRNRNNKSDKPHKVRKDVTHSDEYPYGEYSDGYAGAQGTSSAPKYTKPDPSLDSSNDDVCCDCFGNNAEDPHPIGNFFPTDPMSIPPPTGPIDIPPDTNSINFPPPVAPGSASSPPPAATKGTIIIGFAKEFDTVGGSGGAVVLINSLDDLINNVRDNERRVLIINSNIEESSIRKVRMGSNKSIIGANGNSKLHNIYLRATPSSENIIFQNLIFAHSEGNKGNDDIQLYLNHGKAYWIDHCSFIGHNWSPKDGSNDKLLYIGERATGATISNCYFGNHKYGLIFGHPNDNIKSANKDDTRVTICNNHFENLAYRAPGLFRFGKYHVFNNYINNYGLGFTVATKGAVISEYNYFGSSPNKNAMLDDKNNGQFIDTGSVPPITNQVCRKPEWSPSYHYNLKTSADPGSLNTVNKFSLHKITPSRSYVPFDPQLAPPPNQFMNAALP